MSETSSKSRDHRLRVLEHQARMAGERPAPPRAETQGRIPLLVPVKPAAAEKASRPVRARTRPRPKQASFEGL